MERARAARAIINGKRGSEALALRAFLSIFNPELPEDQVRELCNDVKENK
jgi:hypothetical protein